MPSTQLISEASVIVDQQDQTEAFCCTRLPHAVRHDGFTSGAGRVRQVQGSFPAPPGAQWSSPPALGTSPAIQNPPNDQRCGQSRFPPLTARDAPLQLPQHSEVIMKTDQRTTNSGKMLHGSSGRCCAALLGRGLHTP